MIVIVTVAFSLLMGGAYAAGARIHPSILFQSNQPQAVMQYHKIELAGGGLLVGSVVDEEDGILYLEMGGGLITLTEAEILSKAAIDPTEIAAGAYSEWMIQAEEKKKDFFTFREKDSLIIQSGLLQSSYQKKDGPNQ